jgi:hypothetical protein
MMYVPLVAVAADGSATAKLLLAVSLQILVAFSLAVMEDHHRVCSLDYLTKGPLCSLDKPAWSYFGHWNPLFLLWEAYLGATYINAYRILDENQGVLLGLPLAGQVFAAVNIYLLVGNMWKHRYDYDARKADGLGLLNAYPWSGYTLAAMLLLHVNCQHRRGQMLSELRDIFFAAGSGSHRDAPFQYDSAGGYEKTDFAVSQPDALHSYGAYLATTGSKQGKRGAPPVFSKAFASTDEHH